MSASMAAFGADGGNRPKADPAASGAASPPAEATLLPWSESLFAQVEKEYGSLAAKRLRYVYDTARENQNKPVLEKLKIANSTLNKLPWVADQQQWNSDDYWATPFEILTKVGGDCEDMAIGKYVMLRMMGVPQRNLYLGYGKLKTRNEAHMVLVWVNDQRTDLRILDSFVKDVKTGKERSDLLGIYFTDINGKVILIDDVGGRRKVKEVLTPKKMSKLDALKQHIRDTREKYRAYNEGQPLFKD
jgi:predicted transglutaminase-like cysteine proteinase